MAGPGGRPVGRVSVRVVPDTSTFASALEAYLQRVESRAEVNIPVSLNAASVAATEAKLALLTRDRRVSIDVESRGIDKIGSSLGGAGRGGGIFGIITNPAIIGAAVVAIAAATAAIPGMIAAIAAPIAAIVVGFEGIKRAAQGLALPFQVMQSTVSNVFEKAFLPAFRELVKIFPTLTEGFNTIGVALGKMFTGAVEGLTSGKGLAMLGQIFTNIGTALTALAPAMGPFVETFLLLAREGTAAFARFAPLIAQIIIKFAEFVAMADKLGFLKTIMDGIGVAIVVLLAAFTGLVVVSMLVVGAIGAIINTFVRFGQTIAAAFNGIVGLITSLPGRISGALGSLVTSISGAFTRAFASARAAVSTGVAAVVAFIRTLPGKAKAALGSLPGLLKQAGIEAMNGLWNGLRAIGDKIIGWVQDFAGKVAGALSGIKGWNSGSPSRVFMGIGGDAMAGLRIGLEDGAPSVQDAMSGIAASVAGVVAPNLTMPADDAGAGSSDADMRKQARYNAEALAEREFKLNSRGNLQLIAAGG